MRRIRKFLRCSLGLVSRLPEVIQVEVTGRCNLSCRMCPRGAMGVPERDMEFEVFVEVFSKVRQAEEVILSGWGEPLLHPRFYDMVAYLNENLPKVSVRFTTNGLLLDLEVLEHRVERVTVSVDGPPGRPSGIGHVSSDLAWSNLERLLKARRGGLPEVYIQSVIQGPAEDLVRLAGRLGADGVTLVRLDTRHDPSLSRPSWEEERKIVRRAKAVGRDLGVQVFCANDQGWALRLAGHLDGRCLRTDDYIYVDLDGNVTPCCNLRWYVCGNLLKQDLREIWKGRKFQEFRMNQKAICDGCDALKYRYIGGRRQEAGNRR